MSGGGENFEAKIVFNEAAGIMSSEEKQSGLTP